MVRILPEHTVKNVGGGVEIQLHSFLILELDGDDVRKLSLYFALSCVCNVKTNRWVLFGEIMSVCCGNCRKHINGDFVAICDLMLKC